MAPRRSRAPLVLLAFVALFAASEIGLRVLTSNDSAWNVRLGANKRFDPVTLFRLKSNYEYAEGIYTNEQGYLAPAGLTLAKPPDAKRLIYLGDSVSVLPVPGLYPEQVEERLTQDGLRIQTLNAAVPGFSTRNARALFETELARYDGDYFFVALGWNDLGQFGPEGLPYKRDEVGYRLNPVQRVLTQVYTLRWLYALQDVLRRREPSVDHPLSPDDEKLYDDYYPAHYEENLRAILELAESRYPNVVILNLATITNPHPTAFELATAHYPTGMDKNMRKLHKLVGKYNDVVAKVAAEQQVEMIDLFARFDSEAARREFTDSCHLNRAGAARVAAAVSDVVLRREGRLAVGP